MDSTGGGSLTAGSGVTLTAIVEPELVLSALQPLTEENIGGITVYIRLKGVTFADDTLDMANVTANAPFTVSGVTYIDSTHCTVTIASNGGDFDSAQHLDITIAASELLGGSALTSNQLGVAATDDAESLSISSGTITEGEEDGSVITVTISGGQFAATVTPANWTVTGLPGGVTKGAVTRIDDTHVSITLSGNARWDYDSNITNVAVSCTADEYGDSTGNGSLSATGITINAVNDTERLSISSGTITEGEEDGAAITVTISGGQFAAELDADAWEVGNLPEGVSMGSVTRVGDHTVWILLSGNAEEDYDSDITDVSVICAASQYFSGTRQLTATTGVVLTAINEPAPAATPTATPAATPTATPAATETVVPTATQAPGEIIREITGILLDSNGNPMAGYIVELHSDPVTTVTDAQGRYTFYDVEFTEHTLTVKTPEGEEISSLRLSFSQGEEFDISTTNTETIITYTATTITVSLIVTVSEDQSTASISEITSTSSAEAVRESTWWIWVLVVAMAGIASVLIIWFVRKRKK